MEMFKAFGLLVAMIVALMALSFEPVLLKSAWRKLAGDQRGLMFQRINRSDAERIFGIVYNVTGATATQGYGVVLDTSTFDGLRVTKPATATLSLLVGVANTNINDSSYGIAQVYGYAPTVFVTNDTSQAIAAGDILIPVNAQSYFARSAASDGKSGFVIAGASFATATTPAAANKVAFLRCL